MRQKTIQSWLRMTLEIGVRMKMSLRIIFSLFWIGQSVIKRCQQGNIQEMRIKYIQLVIKYFLYESEKTHQALTPEESYAQLVKFCKRFNIHPEKVLSASQAKTMTRMKLIESLCLNVDNSFLKYKQCGNVDETLTKMKIDILQIGQNKSPNKLMVESSKKKVVITGISGFMGSQVCAAFLRDGGFIVRGTVRDKTNEAKIGPLRKAFGTKFEELELFNADLLQPESLDAAIAGMDYVVHTASPLPFESPEDENVVIKPAVEGTLAVMRAAHKHKVKRVVMTSSAAAVAQKKPENQKELYDESDWSDLDVCPPYEKSKTMAEKAAWNYLDSIQGDRFELVTLNPCFIFGPSLIPGDFASGQMLGSILSGKYPGMPKISLAIVDVRDVALAHLQAIKVREAANQRIILSESTLWFKEIADILNEAFPEFQIKTNELGYCPVKVISWFDKKAARIITRWGLRNVYNNQKSKDILGIQYHSPEENVIAMARSLIENGVVEDKRVKK